jgi:hypothetical protein
MPRASRYLRLQGSDLFRSERRRKQRDNPQLKKSAGNSWAPGSLLLPHQYGDTGMHVLGWQGFRMVKSAFKTLSG